MWKSSLAQRLSRTALGVISAAALTIGPALSTPAAASQSAAVVMASAGQASGSTTSGDGSELTKAEKKLPKGDRPAFMKQTIASCKGYTYKKRWPVRNEVAGNKKHIYSYIWLFEQNGKSTGVCVTNSASERTKNSKRYRYVAIAKNAKGYVHAVDQGGFANMAGPVKHRYSKKRITVDVRLAAITQSGFGDDANQATRYIVHKLKG